MAYAKSESVQSDRSLPCWKGVPITVFSLTALYFLYHPAVYGDAVRYASDVKSGLVLHDPGHLLWRPLGWLLWKCSSFLIPLDPLIIFQVMSACLSALGVVALFGLALKLGFSVQSAILSGLLLASSHLYLAYGASGSSYCPAIGLGTLAVFFAMPQVGARTDDSTSNSAWHLTLSGLCFFLAWSLWAVTVLLYPLYVYSLALRMGGTWRLRWLKAAGVCFVVGVMMVVFTVSAFFLSSQAPHNPEQFFYWMSTSTHGIPLTVSVQSVLRAGLGFFASFLYLGDLGFSLKALLHKDFAEASLVDLFFFSLLALVLAVFFLKAVYRFFFRTEQIDELNHHRVRIGILLFLALTPVTLFAFSWQGSDIERLGLSIPMVCLFLTLTLGLSARTDSRHFKSAHWLALFLYGANLLTLIVPNSLGNGGLTHSFGREMARHLRSDDLIILSGQRLGPRVWSTAQYFYDFRIHSILFDIQYHSPTGWAARLDETLNRQMKDNGKVVVLSDLVDADTPDGIGLSEKEYPVPSLSDVRNYFSSWRKVRSWKVGGFLFYQMVPDREANSPLPMEQTN